MFGLEILGLIMKYYSIFICLALNSISNSVPPLLPILAPVIGPSSRAGLRLTVGHQLQLEQREGGQAKGDFRRPHPVRAPSQPRAQSEPLQSVPGSPKVQ